MDDDNAALPDALYPLNDGSYGNRRTYEVERATSADAETPCLWGKGSLLLNPLTKSYLTPFGFKAVFEHDERRMHESFERAGLDPEKSYFFDGAPDILIRVADERFVPPSYLPPQAENPPLTELFREEDIYLQNFNRGGSKHTGSYTPYIRADDVLRERHAKALAGETAQVAAAQSQPERPAPSSRKISKKQTLSPQRTFTRTSRDKRRFARRSESRLHKDV